jgi:putative glutamine amidotransferase
MLSEKPKIGITMSETRPAESYRWPARKSFDYIKREYYQAILLSGGIPILLANVESASALKALTDSIDGLLLTGGGDMHPRNFGQGPHANLSETTAARDDFELEAIRRAMKLGIPILGICRGHQVLNVALGGTLFQDLSCVGHKTLAHSDPNQTGKVFHKVRIEKGSKLHKAVGATLIESNSSHHQVVDRLGKGLKTVAFAPDGLNEGIEHTAYDFLIGVQWHPEAIFRRSHCRRLFRAFIDAATRAKK